MSTKSLILCFFMTLVIVHQGYTCPQGWLRFGESCFMVIESPVSWIAADMHCKQKGGYLAEINNEMEDVFIKELVRDRNLNPPFVWLGGDDILLEGFWRWDKSNSPINYTDWCEGEPNNDLNEDCLAMTSKGKCKWEWYDEPCSRAYNYICELKYSSNTVIG